VTAALSPVAAAHQRLADAINTVPNLRVVTAVGSSITPPAVVIGPPRLNWRGVGTVGAQPLTAQWNVYLVTGMNTYAIDNLLALVGSITGAVESFTPGVVLNAGPGLYPSPNGNLPAYIIVCQQEVSG
jgi:hypothetical protein